MKIFVTGGASGLGEAITKTLAKDASNIVYFTYSKSGEKAVAINNQYKNTFPIKCDFNEANEVNAFTELIKIEMPDVLINNAYNGEFLKNYFHKTDPLDFLKDFKENILPTIEITQAALTVFRKKKQGKIITILTAALANLPPIGSSVYIANKAYLEKLSKLWATENARFNICSNSVSPSFMQTSLTSEIDERLVDQIVEQHPLKKLLTVNEVADAVLFLVHAGPHINGIDLLINAGTNIK